MYHKAKRSARTQAKTQKADYGRKTTKQISDDADDLHVAEYVVLGQLSPLKTSQGCVCVCVCVFIDLHMTAPSGPVIVVILCQTY